MLGLYEFKLALTMVGLETFDAETLDRNIPNRVVLQCSAIAMPALAVFLSHSIPPSLRAYELRKTKVFAYNSSVADLLDGGHWLCL